MSPTPPSPTPPSPWSVAALLAGAVAILGAISKATAVFTNIRTARRERAEEKKKERLAEIREAVEPLIAGVEAKIDGVEQDTRARHLENLAALRAESDARAAIDVRLARIEGHTTATYQIVESRQRPR